MDDLKDFALLMGAALLAVMAILFAAVSIWSRLAFPADMAELETLRRNAEYADPVQSEDVIGQVVEMNRLIASVKAWNQVPILCIAIPNGWDNVEPIPVPKVAQ